ncbi:hypothetical protein EJ04DRAFT_576070 [Polyplosphaeria fusca]|uniref:Uncharacterized protein n=1 Tax=Polyplosphaeria fusca TaxID=682080 RepID=A0A9P4R2G8_9PLEO|nr:hypothetical protein EJ04DRAFT_576070 [Polyplosphaeria fusca]
MGDSASGGVSQPSSSDGDGDYFHGAASQPDTSARGRSDESMADDEASSKDRDASPMWVTKSTMTTYTWDTGRILVLEHPLDSWDIYKLLLTDHCQRLRAKRRKVRAARRRAREDEMTKRGEQEEDKRSGERVAESRRE